MKSHLLVLSVLAATTFGCDMAFGPGVDDFHYPVAGKYELCRASPDDIVVAPRSEPRPNAPSIPAKVVEIAWDKTFVLAKQQNMRRSYPDKSEYDFEEPVPGKFSYWILNTSALKLFGPFTLEEFNRKRAEMKVSDGLKLRDVYDFRP
jgi:hypothetical protein